MARREWNSEAWNPRVQNGWSGLRVMQTSERHRDECETNFGTKQPVRRFR